MQQSKIKNEWHPLILTQQWEFDKILTKVMILGIEGEEIIQREEKE